ncbi:DUF488 domain-containing protein [Agriterribacter sp.]|uniref:DUF488 domain-containing protein n=1 Tax=Agriterribacter sp. TaxID=2821509 RepID=UPI002CE8EEF9|nr:DUF488 domain-containing protein [Agriterribacter sp.]HRO48007.1 DUF488 domain-containing protein [Agriterribacter sp.]HRQ19338.1 DUF488 domain-containing protein [Agriterribacter sp.]
MLTVNEYSTGKIKRATNFLNLVPVRSDLNFKRENMPVIQIKRIYEPPEENDGFRVLVDRLWPRGIKKELAHIDIWMKEVAPAADLRKWFNHEPEKWAEFSRKYTAGLKDSDAVKKLVGMIRKHKKTTLLYAAHDEQHNQAVVLQQFLKTLIK